MNLKDLIPFLSAAAGAGAGYYFLGREKKGDKRVPREGLEPWATAPPMGSRTCSDSPRSRASTLPRCSRCWTPMKPRCAITPTTSRRGLTMPRG